MKKLLVTVILSLACVAAFAQGKVNFQNNSLHLVYWDTDISNGTNAGLAYIAGQGGIQLAIELWAGTSSTSLTLQSSTDFNNQAAPGTWIGRTVTFASIPAGPIWCAVDIYDRAAGSYLVASTTPGYVFATSGIFTMNASGTIAYNSIVNHNSPANSTWADGTWNMDYLATGFRGAIMLCLCPEPSTLVLSCVGITLLLLRRRAETRKMEK